MARGDCRDREARRARRAILAPVELVVPERVNQGRRATRATRAILESPVQQAEMEETDGMGAIPPILTVER